MGSQRSFQDAFPKLTTSNTFKERRRLNNLVDDIRGRQSQQKRFDPLLVLGDDLLHEILLYVIDPQRIAGSRALETEYIRGHTNGPLVLTNVSWRWSRFITSSPLLWSYWLIDTDDDDALEYLQLFLLLSRNTPLFIALHGRAVVSDTIATALLRAGDRISALLYPPNVSRSTLAKLGLCQDPARNQIEPSCPWYKLEVQSVTQSSQHTNHYYFPTLIQSLSIGVPFTLSNLVTLSHFRSLSSLSAKISLDRALSPGSRLELPNLEELSLQVAFRSDRQVEMPILMICRKLKILHLRLIYVLKLALSNPQEEPASWLKFDVVDTLLELHIHLALQVVTGNGSTALRLKREWPELELELERLELELEQLEQQQQQWEWEQQQQQREWEQQQQREQREHQREQRQRQREQWEQREQQRKQQREQGGMHLQWLRKQRQWREQRREQRQAQQWEQQWEQQWAQQWAQRWAQRQQQQQQELRELQRQQGELQRRRQELRDELQEQKREQREQQQQLRQLRQSIVFVQMHWRQWLNIPDNLDNVRRSSLGVTSSLQKEAYAFIGKTLGETLLLGLPRLMELTTSEILHTFPEHLQKLRLHGFSIPDSWSPIKLPSLVSLEIQVDTLDHLLIMRRIQVPQLRDLQVQVQGGLGKLHEFDWRGTTDNSLDHISLTIEVPHHQQDSHVLVFNLPRTHFLNVSSPHTPLCLYITEPAPFSYTLHAILGAVPFPKSHWIKTTSAEWQENLITEWIDPHHEIPNLARFRSLVSLRRVILDQSQYQLFKQAPVNDLLKLLAENIAVCPQLISITAAECPSSWPTFLCHLRRRNLKAMLSRSAKCIEELSFSQPIHAVIIRWLMEAIKARIFNVTEWPPVREGNAWPMRPFSFVGEMRVFRSCYICHITGMELGCLKHETQSVDCGRERGDGARIEAI
jgi:hypothetical protein